jgi:hypothetical protein
MTEDNRERQGRSKERLIVSYKLLFGAAIGLAIISIISAFLPKG